MHRVTKAFLGVSQRKVNWMVFYKSQNTASPRITVSVSEHTVGPKNMQTAPLSRGNSCTKEDKQDWDGKLFSLYL